MPIWFGAFEPFSATIAGFFGGQSKHRALDQPSRGRPRCMAGNHFHSARFRADFRCATFREFNLNSARARARAFRAARGAAASSADE